MDNDSDKNNTTMLSTSDVLSVILFVFTAYCILKLFQPSQNAPMLEPSPGPPRTGEQEVLRTSDGKNGDQPENAGTEKGSPEEEKYEVRRNEVKKSFGVEDGRTNIISLRESEESGAGRLAEEGEEDEERGDLDWDEDEDENVEDEEDDDGEDEKEAKPKSTKVRGRIRTAYSTPTSPAPPKKQRIINPPRKPTLGLRKFDTNFYPRYNLATHDQDWACFGLAPPSLFRSFSHYDNYSLYINPHLKETELEQIPHHGVRLDDLTASMVLEHYSQRILHARWPAEFDSKGMIRATRVPLGRAAKRWVKRGERDVEGKRVEENGWYYLSWGGIHSLMGKEGLDADRYWVRPSFESFKCPGLGFKREDWAEVQLSPAHPEDPTFL